MQNEDTVRLQHMRDSARSVLAFVASRRREDLDSDLMLRFALIHAITIIGEAAAHVTSEGRQAVPDIPWREAVGIRNRLVHAYFDVDLDVLWKTATESVPVLLERLEALNLQGG